MNLQGRLWNASDHLLEPGSSAALGDRGPRHLGARAHPIENRNPRDLVRCRLTAPTAGESWISRANGPRSCAYCGVPIAPSEGARKFRPLLGARPGRHGPGADRSGPGRLLEETVDYQARKASTGGSAVESFPEQIAGYRLIRKLGSGGMGTVFEAEDEAHSRRVAIKLISSEALASGEALERFRQEGRLASAVTHPRCVFVLAVDEHRGHPYIVMELMPGTTLQNLVEKQGPLEPADAIARIMDVVEGLRQFHKLGLIHRDVKPSNCFLEKEGRVKIGDFGLSKSLDGGLDLTRTGTFIGTPLYASPEQIKRDEVDERTDVYSVSATLYYLLTGRPPVRAKDAAEALARIASEPAPPLRGLRPEISPRSRPSSTEVSSGTLAGDGGTCRSSATPSSRSSRGDSRWPASAVASAPSSWTSGSRTP